MTQAETGRDAVGPMAGRLTTRTAVWIIVALTAARVVALYAARTDLAAEEARYWAWSLEPAFGYFSEPPLTAWVIAAVTAVLGNAEAAVRLASPLMHAATALVLMAVAARTHDESTGAWSGVLWTSMPAVGLSATLISTDVPLLLAWCCALYFLFDLMDRPRARPALLLGVAIGLGFTANYSMAFFWVCVFAMAVTGERDRWLLTSRYLWLAIAVSAVVFAPNFVWNATHGFATINEMVSSLAWQRDDLTHPVRAAAFFTSQFGVFGPFAFAALIAACWAAFRETVTPEERRLLWLSVPVILLVTSQAFLARAYSNWAAVAYPAATILVVAILLRRHWMRPTLAINAVVASLFLVSPAFAPQLTQMSELRPFKRLLGYSDMAAEISRRAQAADVETVVVTRSADAASLIYYLRDTDARVAVLLPPGAEPGDHFSATRPWWYSDSGRTLVLVPGPGPIDGNAEYADSLIDWQEPFAVSPGIDERGMMRTGLVRGRPAER